MPSRHHQRSDARFPGYLADTARGAAIGVVETIPGVSGGTMALIVGVYERLIAAASHLVSAIRGLVDVARGRGAARSREELRQVDWPLVIAIAVGMVAALLIASRVLPPLIDGYPMGTRALFLGMVAASVAVPILALGGVRGVREWMLLVVGAVLTWLVTSLPAASEGGEPSLWLVGFAAALAVCALVLPGLSGSFLLLVLGLYEPTLRAVAEGDLGYVAVFAAGALIGLGSFVTLLQWLLEHHRRTVLAIMTGVLIGALRALWPWQDADGGLLPPGDAVLTMASLALLGAVVVVGLTLLQHRRETAAATI